MQFSNHGGGCCGIRHIHGFLGEPRNHNSALFYGAARDGFGPGNNTRTGEECLVELLRAFDQQHPGQSRLIEAVLTDGQERTWRTQLESRGFRKVVRFQNDNTRAWCNIYHYYRDPARYQVFDGRRPTIPAAEVVPLPAPAPVAGEIVVGSRVNYVGGYQNARPDPDRGTGVVTAVGMERGDQTSVTVRWSNYGANYHYRANLALAAAPEVAAPAQPAPVAAFNRSFTYGDRLYTDARIFNDGSVNAERNGQLNSFTLIDSNDLTRLREAARRASVPPVDARPERRQLFSTWHCEYRGGRRGAGYDTREAAVEANPRVRTVVEKRYYSDGTSDFNVG